MKVFKDSMNKWITSGLFKETAQKKGYVVYTLDECRKKFIEYNDPTGYCFATEMLGGYAHWLALKLSPALEHHILQWEDELTVKLRCQGLQEIISEAKGDKGYQASKYLVEAGWNKKLVGRPSKEAIKKRLGRSTDYGDAYIMARNVTVKKDTFKTPVKINRSYVV